MSRPSPRWWIVPDASEDRHAPSGCRDPATRGRDLGNAEPDEIKRLCIGCTLVYAGGGWQHENSCAFRSRPLRRLT